MCSMIIILETFAKIRGHLAPETYNFTYHLKLKADSKIARPDNVHRLGENLWSAI